MGTVLLVIGISFSAWCVWAVVRAVNDPQRWRTYLGPIGVIVGLVFAVGFFLPAVTRSREPARRTQCKINLKQIGLALHQYHEDYGSFPPAYVPDTDGKPMHSWRVLLLPYLDHSDVYKEYRFDEPWDGPNNSKLASKKLSVFYCPSETHGGVKNDFAMTNYVAVVGRETAWPGGKPGKLGEIKDGTSNTLLIVEIANSGIPWMEPRDLDIAQMAPTINAKSGQGISSAHAGGAQALLADGTVRFISSQTTAELIRGLLTINGGETIGLF